MVAEKKTEDSTRETTIVVIIMVVIIIIGIVIAIPLVYVTGRQQGIVVDPTLALVPQEYVYSECTQSMSKVEKLRYLYNEEPFPYRYFTVIYRPSVIVKKINLIFGFRHDLKSWSIDKISVNDTTTGNNIITDGDFESNYLNLHYTRCILSNTRYSNGDILFDLPYSQDFYYNDQTNVGMTFLSQSIDVIGGRYYNISFYLENRGYPNNTFVLLVGS